VPAADVISIAASQSILTHAHPIALMCCAIYAQLAYSWLLDPTAPVAATVASAASEVSKHPIAADPAMQAAILKIVNAIEDGQPSGSGYCVSTLVTAIWSVDQHIDYLSAVRSVIRLGGDTDTTACVTGGLASLRYELDSVPDDWWPQLDMPIESRKLLKSLAR
jgi:ADP-ribosyl-[dinitrogen reductase] hydrolase